MHLLFQHPRPHTHSAHILQNIVLIVFKQQLHPFLTRMDQKNDVSEVYDYKEIHNVLMGLHTK